MCTDYGDAFVANLYNASMLSECQEGCLPDCNYESYPYSVKVTEIGDLDMQFSDRW